MSEAKLEAYFLTALFLGALVLTGALFLPFLGALATAIVLAALVQPFYVRVRDRVGHETAAAGFVVCIIALALVLPGIGLFSLLTQEVQGFMTSSATWHSVPAIVQVIDIELHALIPALPTIDLSQVMFMGVERLSALVTAVLAGAASWFVTFVVFFVSLFYFIRDGAVFVRTLVSISPLTRDEEHIIVEKLCAVTQSLIRGTLVLACIHGILVSVGFYIFQIPNPVLWGAIAVATSLIPSIGTFLVTIPGVFYAVLFMNNIAAGVGLFAWSIVLIGFVDNLVGPRLMGKHARIHPLLILLAVFGGLSVLGLTGFLIGPLVLGTLVALFEIYKVKVTQLRETVA